MLSIIKPSNRIYECLLVSVLTTFSGAATNFAASTVSPTPETKKMMGDEPFGATAAGLF